MILTNVLAGLDEEEKKEEDVRKTIEFSVYLLEFRGRVHPVLQKLLTHASTRESLSSSAFKLLGRIKEFQDEGAARIGEDDEDEE